MSDLFDYTSKYYSKYRDKPPIELLARFKNHGLSSESCVLDVGTGTGQIPDFLKGSVKNIVGIDISTEMIEEAKRVVKADNIEFWILPAEDINEDLGKFDFITFSASFHWMDKDRVLTKCKKVLNDNGKIVIMASASSWNSDEKWERAIVETVQKYLGKERRAGKGTFAKDDRKFEDILEDNEFTLIERDEIYTEKSRTFDKIVGLLYSTSYGNKSILGDKVDRFETELREKLSDINQELVFRKTIKFEYMVFQLSEI